MGLVQRRPRDGGDTSLLVDTLFDLRLTAEMLAAMRRTTPAAEHIGTVVNTHANGDHCYGNALVAGSEILSTARCAEEMGQLPPSTMAAMMRAAPSLGPAGEFLARIFAPFYFDDVPLTLPSRTFEGRLDLRLGDRPVSLVEVGPAHTAGDAIVHLPDRRRRLHRRHPLPWRPPHRVGRSGGQLDRGLRPHPRPGADGGRARARPAGDARPRWPT